MALKLHIICAKCGSDDIHIQLLAAGPDNQSPEEQVCFVCRNCAELTSVGEWAEANRRTIQGYKVGESVGGIEHELLGGEQQ